MVILKRIKRTDDNISADYYPDGKEKKGFMRIKLNTGEVIEHEIASMFSAPHVKRELISLSNLAELPEEKAVIWY